MGFLQLCALRLLGCPGGKRKQSVTKGRLHGFPWQIQGNTWSQGSDELSGLWEKPFQGNALLGDIYWHQAVCPHCLQGNLGLFCSYQWWTKPITEIWSVNYWCSSAACCLQVSFSNILLHLWNKPTWFEVFVHLHTERGHRGLCSKSTSTGKEEKFCALCILENVEFITMQPK